MTKKKNKGLFSLKIKADGVPLCDGYFNSFEKLEESFEKTKKKLK